MAIKNIDKNEEEVDDDHLHVFTSAIWFPIDVECVLWPHDRTLSVALFAANFYYRTQ